MLKCDYLYFYQLRYYSSLISIGPDPVELFLSINLPLIDCIMPGMSVNLVVFLYGGIN
jgi:hypothetical protein